MIQPENNERKSSNLGELVFFYNPGPYVPEQEREVKQVEFHRDNTPWFMTIPSLSVSIQLYSNEKPVTGYQRWSRLLEMADSIISQLKSMTPDKLLEYQTNLPNFAQYEHPDPSLRGTFQGRYIPESF